MTPGEPRAAPPEPCGLPVCPTADPGWLLVEEGVDRAREREIESIFALANGRVGTRASLEEGGPFSDPATFASGVYTHGDDGDLGPALAVLPDWAHVEIAVDGQPLSLEVGRVLEHRRTLDLRQGVLWREWRQRDPAGRVTRVASLRLASLADRHLLVQSVAVTAENYAGRVRLCAGPGAGARAPVPERVPAGGRTLLVRANGAAVAIASASALRTPHGLAVGEEAWVWDAGVGETARLDRVVAVYTSRASADPAAAAARHVAAVGPAVETAVRAHAEAWRRRWEAAGVQVAGDDLAQRALRFAVYHLVSAADPDDEHVSIGARDLTGAAYRGHVFWDTEIYMLPFYVHTEPRAARALLMYRFHTLDAARAKARAHGYRGALYAWESADTGDEVTPRTAVLPGGPEVAVLTGDHEHHISADVAYAVWRYWRATGDDDFLVQAGAEILVETARFWASRATVEAGGRAHVRDVIGPDEYHVRVDDNAFTNAMARFNLERAADALAFLDRERPRDAERLRARLGLDPREPDGWRRVAAALVTGFDPARGLHEQFAGYFDLDEVDVRAHLRCAMPIDVCLGPERTARTKAIKQADVVMLAALLWDAWPREVHEANFRYYEPRTAHGSSLSPAIHALVAARLGDGALARDYFRQAAGIDLADTMGNAAGGVHMAALGGLWQAAVFGAAGLSTCDDGVALDPHLLPGWTEMRVPFQWRGRSLRVRLLAEPGSVEVEVEGGALRLSVAGGPAFRARPGRRYAIERAGAGWGAWRERDA